MQPEAQTPVPPANLGIQILAWIEVHKKRLAYSGAALVGVILVVSLIVQHQAGRETAASEALSEIRVPFSPGVAPEPGTADKLYKFAHEHKGTRAAARALIVSAGILYTDKEYAKAQERFNALIQQYPESPWVSDAHLGVAACLEAQGKIDEAIRKYDDVRKRYATMPVNDDAKLALARLYESSNPTESFRIYEELVKANPTAGIGAEAGMRQEELLKRNPELAKLREPVTPSQPVQITPPPDQPAPTNRTISLTNLMQPRTNPPGTETPAQLEVRPDPAVSPEAGTPAPSGNPAPDPPK